MGNSGRHVLLIPHSLRSGVVRHLMEMADFTTLRVQEQPLLQE